MWRKDHQCKCVKSLSEKLLDYRLKRAIVFEDNQNFVIGIVMDVDDGVLKLINAEHYVEINSIYTKLVSPKVFISLCHITGFASADNDLIAAMNNTIDSFPTKKINAI